jgi:arginase
VAVKIVRQHSRIALLGAPMSAAALAPGGEGAPSALRKAGFTPKLQSAGYEVTDLGDDPAQVYQPDTESPRARNLPRVLAGLEALRPRVELAVKSGALPVILGGDCTIVLAVVAGLRRYYRNVSLLYADADADLQTPATTTSGCVDGMVVSHLAGRGASEMVRFWSEPPLVRDPDLALFGVSRLDPAEEQVLQTAPLRRYLAEDIRRKSPAKMASEAIERIHGNAHEFVLHFDVDVIANFQTTNLPSADGLRAEEVREAFEVFMEQPHLAAIVVSGYNPERDADGAGAKFVVEFVGGLLAGRRPKMKDAPAPASKAAAAKATKAAEVEKAAEEEKFELPAAAVGEAWSSDMLDEAEHADETSPAGDAASADLDESEEPQA